MGIQQVSKTPFPEQNSSFLKSMKQSASKGKKWVCAHPFLSTFALSMCIGGVLVSTNSFDLQNKLLEVKEQLFSQFVIKHPVKTLQTKEDPFAFITSYFNQKNFYWALEQGGALALNTWNIATFSLTHEYLWWPIQKLASGILTSLYTLQAIEQGLHTVASHSPSPQLGAALLFGTWFYFHPKHNQPIKILGIVQNTFYPSFSSRRR